MTIVRAELRGIEEVEAFLDGVPRGTKTVAAPAVADYLIGDIRHGLKYYPAYKKITRMQAYGKTFVSDRQRRWFFASLRDGSLVVPYVRTEKLRKGWHKIGNKWNPVIRNRVDYAHYVVHDQLQSRMSKKIGWRTISRTIKDNIRGAMRSANAAVKKWLDDNQK